MKAFREQLEKLDEKTLDFATSQETKTLLGGLDPEFHQFRWDPNSPIHWEGASRDHGRQFGDWAAQHFLLGSEATGDGSCGLSSAKEVELLVEALNDSNAMPGT